MQKFFPFGDRLLVKTDKTEETTTKGIIIPATAGQNTAIQGEVLAMGDGGMTPEGSLIPMKCKVGDKVMFPSYSGVAITINDEKLTIISEKDVTGRIREITGE